MKNKEKHAIFHNTEWSVVDRDHFQDSTLNGYCPVGVAGQWLLIPRYNQLLYFLLLCFLLSCNLLLLSIPTATDGSIECLDVRWPDKLFVPLSFPVAALIPIAKTLSQYLHSPLVLFSVFVKWSHTHDVFFLFWLGTISISELSDWSAIALVDVSRSRYEWEMGGKRH